MDAVPVAVFAMKKRLPVKPSSLVQGPTQRKIQAAVQPPILDALGKVNQAVKTVRRVWDGVKWVNKQ